MSHKLINHNKDLAKLRDNGYEVAIRNNFLMVTNIPYVNPSSTISFGTIVSSLTLKGESTIKPDNHVVYFIGEHPHHSDGTIIKQIMHTSRSQNLGHGITVNHSFSNKPRGGFSNYFDKMTSYINIIENEAKAIDQSVTAKTYKIVDSMEIDSVFNYPDTNSSRAEINNISSKLEGQKIGIIGLGGTGSYVLDFIAKTPVKEIHLFDDDHFFTHNAFRAPSAPTLEELNSSLYKAQYFEKIYSKMHKNIISHCEKVNDFNIHKLTEFDFVFICIDSGKIKFKIVQSLEAASVSFIDVGMGLEIVDNSIIGILRTTTSTEKQRDHIHSNNRISFSDGEDNVYSNNIQIAELNALNAAHAVIKWKKYCGFYQDLTEEHHSTFSINDNSLINEDET